MRCSFWLAPLLLLAACAPMRPENRYALTELNEHLVPESTAGRWALSPVAMPVGLVTYFVDGLLIHPFFVWDDAWTETRNVVWDTSGESRFRRALTFPVRIAGTPLVWTLDLLRRWLLPVENKALAEQPWDQPPGADS